MELETTRFGKVDIDPGEVITFTQPILGFQEHRRFVLMPGPSPALRWLQSITSGELAFILIDPKSIIPDYKIEISQHDLAELSLSDLSEGEVYTLVVVPDDASKIRTNLKAPIIMNLKQCLGKQVVLDRSDYPIQYYLAQAKDPGGEAREASNARSNA
ncbi:MAG: flagellar assembly protein FliW [Candidatus Hydrogenedentes bacterium]|nr:flagellar assembly protein FliW [Candidatus Hydrogenedentota bacterium]